METRRRSTRQKEMRSTSRGIRKPTSRAKKTGGISTTAQSTTSKPKRRTGASGKKSRHYLESYYAQKAPGTNATTILFRQPRELFFLIINHLPIESRVSLSLTCKHALQIIGTECWQSPDIQGRLQNGPRQTLMQYLARDAAPHLTFCAPCCTLHPPLKHPNSHCETKLTKVCMSQWGLIDYFPQVKNDDGSPGYSLVYPHIQSVFASPSSLDTLVGRFTADSTRFKYTLASSAAWVKGNLTLQHIHYFTPNPSFATLRLEDILNLPLQICPHHSTTTGTPTRSVHTPNRAANGRILTHAIAAAFPLSQRTGIPKPDVFRAPTPLEKKQIALVESGEDVIWKCRGCATKFRVELADGSLLITSWHCFGSDLIHTVKYWKWLVRREAYNLGPGKRNSEFWYQSRTVPDFPIQQKI